MSTILKALRRLEEDSSIDGMSAASEALPATDPPAADELRSRILAEESAALESDSDSRRPSMSTQNIFRVAALIATAAIVVGIGVALYTPSPSNDSLQPIAASPPTPLLPPATEQIAERPAEPAPVDEVMAGQSILVASSPPIAIRPQDSSNSPAHVSPPNATPSSSLSANHIPPSKPNESSSGAVAPPPRTLTEEPEKTDQPAAPTDSDKDQGMALAAVVPTPAVIDSQTVKASPTTTSSNAASPERTASTPTPSSPAVARSTPAVAKPTPAKTKASVSASAPKPEAEVVEHHNIRALPDVTVLRTAWHPTPDRRSAKIRMLKTNETLTLREGDAVGGLVVKAISPSAVLFQSGEVEIRLRVGQPGSGR